MKLLEYANTLWVKLEDESVQINVPYLCLDTNTYETVKDYLNTRYGIKVRSVHYVSTETAGVVMRVILKEETVDLNTLLKLQNGLSGIINISSGTYANEENPYCGNFTYILIPIDQEVEIYEKD